MTSSGSALIAAALVVFIGAWHMLRTRDVLLANAENDARNLARALSQHAARTFEGADLVLSGINERVEGNPDRDHLKEFLERRASHAAQLSNLVVTNAQGDWIADAVPPHEPISSADRPYFQWHRDHPDRGLRIGDPIRGRYGEQTIIPLSRQLNNPDGSFGGVAVGALKPGYLEAFYQTVHIGKHGSVSLYSADGHILARYPAASQDANLDAARVAQSAKDFAVPSGISRMRARLDGIERIFAFEHIDGYPLVVSAGIAVEDVLGHWRKEALIESIVIAIVGFGLVALGIGSDRHRRDALAAARRSQEIDARYRLLAENSTDIVALKPSFAGARTYVSPSCRSILGWEPEAFAALSAAESIHPDDVKRVAALFATLTPDNPRATSLHRLRHQAGHYVWVETIFQLTGVDSPEIGVIATARDVSARMEAEDARRESEERYRLLAENSSDLIALKPSFAGARAYVSPSSRVTVGWEPEELAALPMENWIHPKDFDRVAADFESLGANNPRIYSVHRVRHKDGHYIWIDATFQLTAIGTPNQAVLVAARDVTSRRQAEESLRASETRYRLLAHASSDVVARVDLDGRHSFASPASSEILAYRPEEMIGSHVLDYVQPDDVEQVKTLLDSLVEGHCDQARSVHRARHRAGHEIWVDVQYRLVRDKNSGLPIEIVSSLRDVTEREELQRRLKNTNDQLLAAEQLAHMGHWRVDLRQGVCTWSDGVYRIHGRQPQEFVPTLDSSIEAYHPDDRAGIKRMFADAVEKRVPYISKVRLIRSDGAVRHVMSRGVCEIDESTNEVVAIFGAIMDVTDLADAERKQRRQSSLLETTLNNMDQGLIKVASDGAVVLANRRLIELLDLPGELFDQPTPMFADIVAHLRDNGERLLTGPLTPGTTSDASRLPIEAHEHLRPNGKVIEIRTVRVSSGAYVSTFADVTARRRAEVLMRESEARYRMLADATSDVITQLDLDLVRQYVSPACRAVLGYEPAEMLGIRPEDFIHPDDAPTVRTAMQQLATGTVPGDQTRTTNRMRHKEGHWIWLEASLNLIRDPETGAPSSIVCSLRDVTERQRAARHLSKAKAAAEQAAKAKSAFVANMSHELRTPLTGMLGIHDLLRRDPALGDAQRRLVGLASASGRSLLNIVNDILDFSKIEAGQLAIETVPFDLRTLIETCRALGAEGLNGKPVEIATQFDPAEPGWFIGDPNRLQQVLLNLLTNAVKFTESGTVTIDVAYRSDTGKLRVAVSDTGVGIPADKLPLLFERFSQADVSTARRYGGTGLGLAISKHLVELMGGQIAVTSRHGHGSCFWFELSLVSYDAATDPSQMVELERPEHRGYRILLAEDNLVNQEIIQAMLTSRGHSITVVADGAAAAAAAGSNQPFDLVLMDIQMPGMDGLTATGVIRQSEERQQRARLPIIGLTANAMMDDVEVCLRAGMDGHVAKPIDWPVLLTAIEEVVAASRDEGSRSVAPPQESDGVLDRLTVEELERVIGRERLGTMLATFADDLERRLQCLVEPTHSVLSAQTHSLISMAGQFGFMELSKLCIDIQAEARGGGGLQRMAQLREAAHRALSVARAESWARAA